MNAVFYLFHGRCVALGCRLQGEYMTLLETELDRHLIYRKLEYI